MTHLTKHLPLEHYEGSILSALGKGVTVADAHHDLSPAEGEAVMAEIVRRVNLHDRLVAALQALTADYVQDDAVGRAVALLAEVDAAKEAR
jgi:hypothetical protein